jgi:hypothetical protein
MKRRFSYSNSHYDLAACRPVLSKAEGLVRQGQMIVGKQQCFPTIIFTRDARSRESVTIMRIAGFSKNMMANDGDLG